MDAQISMPPPPPPPPPPFFAETTAPQLTVPPLPPPPQPVTTTTTTTTTAVVSTPTKDRIWLHPWTVTEMRENASQWSLAGDAGVLLYLEQFSDKLIQRADAIQQHLSQTVNAVKSTHTRVQNCLNEFTSLANTQFIENRVYDEDETANATPSKKDEQPTEKANVSNTEAQEKVLQRYVEAIKYGLTILDTHFERVDSKLENGQTIGASFADDDEDGGVPLEPILEPKDPYIFRPLPYLIGTTEFMDDDYVGLGDLLNTHDEGAYDVVKIKNEDPDSALSSSDDDEEEQEQDDFQVEVSAVPIVPAGASRPDLASRAATRISLTDSEDDDDPFGMNIPKFNVFSPEKSTFEDNLSEKPKIPAKPEKPDFTEESDDVENDMFGFVTNKPPPSIVENNVNIDNESITSKDTSDTEESNRMGGVSMFGDAPQKGMSELEKAVLRRRKAMGDTDLPASNDSEEDEITKPSTKKPRNATISSLGIKTKKPPSESPSSSTISNLTSQPLTKPDQSLRTTIFGGHKPDDDDDEDFFGDAPKLKPLPSSTTIVDTKPLPLNPPKEVKGIFDHDTDEDDDPFTNKKKAIPSSKPLTKIDRNSKIQPLLITKPQVDIGHDESDEDDVLFGAKQTKPKKIATVQTTKVTEKPKSPSSDEDLFPTLKVDKPQLPSTTRKTSDDEEPLFVTKLPVRQSAVPSPIPTVVPLTKNPVSTAETDSENEMFGITKTKLETPATKLSKPTEDDQSLGTSKISTTKTQKMSSPIKSDDDDDQLFVPKPKFSLPPPVVLPPLPPSPSVTIAAYEDPLSGIRKPVETTPKPSSVVEQRKTSTSDSEEDSSRPTRAQNKTAVKEGEKPNVKDLAKMLGIPLNAHKPGAGPRAHLTVKEQPQPSQDDEEPIQKVETPPTIGKKSPALYIDSDEDDLFETKKKPIPTAPIVEQKDKTNVENASVSVKERASGLKIPMMNKPDAQPKSASNEDTDLNNTTPALPTKTRNEEPTADKTMLNIFNDRVNVSNKKRTPPTRKTRTAASSNENDDLFASTNSTNNVISSPVTPPPPTVAPVLPPPSTIVKKSPAVYFDSDEDDLFDTKKKPTSTTPIVEQKDKINVENGRVSVKELASGLKIPMMNKPDAQPKSASNEDNDSNNSTPALPTETRNEEPTADKTMLNIFNDRVNVANKNRTPPTRKTRTATAASANDDDDLFALPNSTNNVSSSPVPSTVPVTGLPNTAAISAKQTNLKERKKFSLFDSDDSDIDELLFGYNKKTKSSVTSKPTTASSKAPTKAVLPPIDDDDSDFLSKRPIKKNSKPMDSDDIFADVKSKGPQANKAKKDWSILEKPAGEKDDIFNDVSTAPVKSSAASKSKSTNVKNKSTKDLDDIFDDPLNVSSKR